MIRGGAAAVSLSAGALTRWELPPAYELLPEEDGRLARERVAAGVLRAVCARLVPVLRVLRVLRREGVLAALAAALEAAAPSFAPRAAPRAADTATSPAFRTPARP
jgi:hypothetical protein